jgi:hypothetical protein
VEHFQLVGLAVHIPVADEGKMIVVEERRHCTVVALVGVVVLQHHRRSKDLLANTVMRCMRKMDFAGPQESRRPRWRVLVDWSKCFEGGDPSAAERGTD